MPSPCGVGGHFDQQRVTFLQDAKSYANSLGDCGLLFLVECVGDIAMADLAAKPQRDGSTISDKTPLQEGQERRTGTAIWAINSVVLRRRDALPDLLKAVSKKNPEAGLLPIQAMATLR
jgi:hypothetical protein